MRLFSAPAAGTAASTYDLIDFATVKKELNIDGTDNDTMLARWITAASKRIVKYCNREAGGFDPIPEDVAEMCLRVVKTRWTNRLRDPVLCPIAIKRRED